MTLSADGAIPVFDAYLGYPPPSADTTSCVAMSVQGAIAIPADVLGDATRIRAGADGKVLDVPR